MARCPSLMRIVKSERSGLLYQSLHAMSPASRSFRIIHELGIRQFGDRKWLRRESRGVSMTLAMVKSSKRLK